MNEHLEGDGAAADICITMLSFCVRKFNVKVQAHRKLFTKNFFSGFLNCTIVANSYLVFMNMSIKQKITQK